MEINTFVLESSSSPTAVKRNIRMLKSHTVPQRCKTLKVTTLNPIVITVTRITTIISTKKKKGGGGWKEGRGLVPILVDGSPLE